MRVEVIDMEQTKNEAKKYILKKIPLVSKVFQFYRRYKIRIYRV